MANVQVRGCCCGIPFGCGTLVLALAAAGLWHLAIPGQVSPAGQRRPAQLVKLDGARPRPFSVEVPVEEALRKLPLGKSPGGRPRRGALSVAAFRPAFRP
jgi:hypothetical protein